jgi:hypothetical protein
MEQSAAFKDRKNMLTFFGVLLILMGLFSFLIFLITIITIAALPPGSPQSEQLSISSAVGGLIFYILAAAVFIILGIGSIKATRWARTLSLLLSWITFIVGILMFLFFIIWGNDIFNQTLAQNPSAVSIAKIFMYAFIMMFFVILPGIFILFYQSEDVIRTVHSYDQKERWTDKCPLPLLAVSFMFLYTSITPFFYIAYGFVAPFFGIFLTGLPAAVLLFANSALCVYLAIGFYLAKKEAWYYGLYLYAFWTVSVFITLLFNDFLDMYRYMNIPQASLAILNNIGIFSSGNMFIIFISFLIPYLAFYLYIRRYFQNEPGY